MSIGSSSRVLSISSDEDEVLKCLDKIISRRNDSCGIEDITTCASVPELISFGELKAAALFLYRNGFSASVICFVLYQSFGLSASKPELCAEKSLLNRTPNSIHSLSLELFGLVDGPSMTKVDSIKARYTCKH